MVCQYSIHSWRLYKVLLLLHNIHDVCSMCGMCITMATQALNIPKMHDVHTTCILRA